MLDAAHSGANAHLSDRCMIADDELRTVLAAAVKQYATRAAERRLDIFPSNGNVTATEVMITVTAMLKACDVQLFELGIWQTFSGARAR